MIIQELGVAADAAVIMADPPWPYKDSGRPLGGHAKHFRSMTIEEIIALGANRSLGARNCLLFLWTTNAKLATGEASAVVHGWGFDPKTIHTWVKMAKNGNQRISTGDYGRNSTEHFIVARRGKVDLSEFCAAPAIPTAHLWPWQSRYARKPEGAFQLVERVSPGPYLEMFARMDRTGWYTWGDEVEILSDA